MSKPRLADIYPDLDNKCERCAHSPANLTHILVLILTDKLPEFHLWNVVTGQSYSTSTITPCCYFWNCRRPHSHIIQTQILLIFTTLLSFHRILLSWKSSVPPSLAVWFKCIIFFLKLENIKFTLRGSTDRFNRQVLLTLATLNLILWGSLFSSYWMKNSHT